MFSLLKKMLLLASFLAVPGSYVLHAASEGEKTEVELPEGVSAVWKMEKAFSESTETRRKICINGL